MSCYFLLIPTDKTAIKIISWHFLLPSFMTFFYWLFFSITKTTKLFKYLGRPFLGSRTYQSSGGLTKCIILIFC